LARFDVFAAAGGVLTAVDRSFEASCGDDGLLIEFRPATGDALVSAISITPE
jgi:beta-galactosidase